MESGRALLVSGTFLLAISALLGFAQERHRDRPDAFSNWRVVHAGGTAGAVQLLALSFIWTRLMGHENAFAFLAGGIIFATWAFFIGPLARAMGRPQLARWVNRAGALVAAPSYVALPLILWWCT